MITYEPRYLNIADAINLFGACSALPLEQRNVVVWEKQYRTPRLICYMADSGQGYRFSNQITPAEPWNEHIFKLRERLEAELGTQLHSALINLYRDGQDTVGWHRDKEEDLGKQTKIVSISLGVGRRFILRKIGTKEKTEYLLEDGDLLVMDGEHITDWEHSVPRTAKVLGQRINITFRSFL